MSRVISETTKIIWNALKDTYMPVPTTDEWKEIAKRYYELWNLPNCLGSIDGKHIRIQKFPNTGSANYNYKGYHSIILLGCCDADGYFTSIECGFAGRNSDGGVFQVSALGHWLEREGLNIPTESTALPNDATGNRFPYFFVGDNAFPLRRNLLRPYSVRNLDNVKRIYNYRLSRGRKSIECTFGMLTQKFQILLKAISCRKYSTIISIIQCVCILHNYIRRYDGVQYTTTTDSFNVSNIRHAPILIPNMTFVNTPNGLRNYLANYFLQPNVALPWQWNNCIFE